MQLNSTFSAILRGRWLLDKQWADAQIPLVFSFLRGESVDFGIPNKKSENEIILPLALASNSNLFEVSPGSNTCLPKNSIAVVNLEGPMLKRGGMCSYGMVDQADLIKQYLTIPMLEGSFKI